MAPSTKKAPTTPARKGPIAPASTRPPQRAPLKAKKELYSPPPPSRSVSPASEEEEEEEEEEEKEKKKTTRRRNPHFTSKFVPWPSLGRSPYLSILLDNWHDKKVMPSAATLDYFDYIFHQISVRLATKVANNVNFDSSNPFGYTLGPKDLQTVTTQLFGPKLLNE